MMFVDSLVGYSVSNNQGPGINYVFKTTNGGDNWMQVFETSYDPARVFFLNRDTGFINGGSHLYRTKNGGGDWEEIFTPPNFELYDFAAISIDTIIISTSYIEGESIWRTENGGNLWVRRYTGTTVQKLYMYDNRLGFAGYTATTFFMRTSNSGINWTRIEGQKGFEDIKFSDSLLGWKSRSWDDDSLRKTTDGGRTWGHQVTPTFARNQVAVLSNDTLNGWGGNLIHTTDGGGPLVGISKNENETVSSFRLNQNYPNPFNPGTKITFYLEKPGYAVLKVFDIKGGLVKVLIDNRLNSGVHETEFNADELPGGIYFYRLEMLYDSGEPETGSRKMILIR